MAGKKTYVQRAHKKEINNSPEIDKLHDLSILEFIYDEQQKNATS